ncbi:hypothetical protein ARAM_003597 [Aspergillus rambellii]|uniref:Uncharacterized protein n=1 Tax=Aspergillus rambellii TaxID=308745 RepID=A0A0F8UKI2_9EURO|nr:hypothetical protein ARAM_003597 [Aspergillus rambellii]
MIPHRSTTLISIIVFVALLLLIFSSSPRSSSFSEEISAATKYVPKFPSFDDLHLPSFHPTAHQPPEAQQNSSSGDSKWFSNWQWINPFSSSITLDENRAVLPPLRERPYIYTYYDPNKGNSRDDEDADAQLLLAWRRAWYAQGFRPVVLGHGEAIANPLYEVVKPLDLNVDLEKDILRWLAWGHMGDGLLADWRCFPMARYDDPTLADLRRGTDPAFITRFHRLDGGLCSGAIAKTDEKFSKSVVDALPNEMFKIEESSSLAFYDSTTVSSHYPTLVEKSASSPSAGRLALVELINSHLRTTFQNTFPGGIAILKPFPQNTTALVEPALRLAKALGQCSGSVEPSSCPPNLQKCRPCDPEQPMLISQPATYRNNTQVFTIGTLPHPYTLISLQQHSIEVTTRHVRRETERDTWLKEVTSEHLGRALGGAPRAAVFKKAVADDSVVGTSLWMTVESLPPKVGQALPSELLDEFEWQFGFKIPRDTNVDAKNEGEAKESMQHANPSQQGVAAEYEILRLAREGLKSKDTNRINIKDVAEAWNLADTEVWRFVKAYRARSIVERQKWEEDEKDFLGARPKA